MSRNLEIVQKTSKVFGILSKIGYVCSIVGAVCCLVAVSILFIAGRNQECLASFWNVSGISAFHISVETI